MGQTLQPVGLDSYGRKCFGKRQPFQVANYTGQMLMATMFNSLAFVAISSAAKCLARDLIRARPRYFFRVLLFFFTR